MLKTERSRPKEWVTQLPLEGYKLLDPPPVGDLAPYFGNWLRHERSDDYWRPGLLRRRAPARPLRSALERVAHGRACLLDAAGGEGRGGDGLRNGGTLRCHLGPGH